MREDSDVTGVSEGLLSRGELPARPLTSSSPCPSARGQIPSCQGSSLSPPHPVPFSAAFWLEDRPTLASLETCSTSAAPLAPPHLFTHRRRSNPLLSPLHPGVCSLENGWKHLRIWGFLTQYLPILSPQPQRLGGHGPRQAPAAPFCCSADPRGLWGEEPELACLKLGDRLIWG